ncbi:tRNA1(Val) (adenine(37)-N6)-methyltransferase [Flavihumibacter profundi]|uniref:tRNA1(Val) (adenine(37)-N6)-methyltransferase n=1 Tax=Flavihumibacter profundi TaxID=2716883 RepID=UPI001CC5944A|nr:methyltransferase [Flavihumibacter profundi]MBZ5856273.1 methyltransferase [Flavihumibacter profundi]
MSNTYFQFKEFIVHQEKSAMKVCTDAALFGAWVAVKFSSGKLVNENVLDIGTGTGLLSLMLSQQLSIKVEAVEVDHPAYEQAMGNIALSPWNNQIRVIHKDILAYVPDHSYGLIISNPPFYPNDLKSGHMQKNLAKHESNLSLSTLFGKSIQWMDPSGYLALLLPAHREGKAIQEADRLGMHLCYKALVRQTPGHAPFRTMLIFSRAPSATESEDISIKSDNFYTQDFISLLRPYYLYL